MNLDDASQSGTLFSRLGELAQRFIAGHASEQEAPIPAWLDGFPSCLSELHQILTRWNGAVAAFSGGFGEQDSLFLPPRRLPTGHFLLVRENQGGFELRIAEQGGNWVARRFENSDITPVDSLDGYLVSFALQEMVMSAPLWAIEESMNGIPAAMTPDLTLIWSDAKHAGYVPNGDLRFYWHNAGAIVLADERGRVDAATHDLTLTRYFETLGLYDIR